MHHVDMALQYERRVVGIREGRIVFDGPSSAVTNNLLKEIYGREMTDDDIMAK